MKNFRQLLLTMVVLLAGIGLYVRTRRPAPLAPASPAPVVGSSITASTAPSASRVTGPAKNSAPRTGDAAWSAFREKFGGGLEPRYAPGGVLASARGPVSDARRADPDFRPDEPAKVAARAREVIDAARELLGIEEKLPLGDPIVRAGAVSAQATFRERFDHRNVEPYGTVTVDLGPGGELLAIDSSYVPGIRPVNSPKLRPAEASAVALMGRTLEGGAPILWVDSPAAVGGQNVPARYAFDFYFEGQRIVVDAADGKILARRDQRHY